MIELSTTRDGLRRRAVVLLGCTVLCWMSFASCATAEPSQPVEYPRARVIRTTQDLAQTLDDWVSAFAPAVPGLIGTRGELAFEDLAGNTFRALDAYTFADVHWAKAQALALDQGQLATAAEIAIARGEIALIRGDYASVERLSTLLMELGTRAHLEWAEASAEEYSGVLDRRHGKLDDATRHEQRSIELMRERGDEAGVATVLTNLGTIARDRGDYASALDWFMQALAIRERIDNRLELTLRNLALIYRDLGDDAATRKYFSRALEVAGRNGDSANYAATLGTFASYLADVREFEPALAAADESLAIGEATGNRPSAGFSLLDSGRALLGLGRLDEAAVRLNDALAVGLSLDQHEIMARARVALAETALARGDRQEARRFLDATLASPQASDSKPLLVEAYALRERLAAADGDNAAALTFAHAQATLREELLGTRANRRLSALETQYARSASEQKLALVTKDNQLQAARLDREQLERRYGVAMLAALTLLLGLLAWRFFGVRRLNRALAARNIEIEAKRKALSEANMRLEQQAQQLYEAAITDSLTGVFNRGHLMRRLEALLPECHRDGKELGLLLIDFDHFKHVNDTQGHIFGDRVLVTGVHALRDAMEPDGVLGRYGGEEFVAAVSGRTQAEVLAIAERLRSRAAEALSTFAPELDPRATISIGIALLSQLSQPHKVSMLIDAADQAVYAAKQAGRNQVRQAQAA